MEREELRKMVNELLDRDDLTDYDLADLLMACQGITDRHIADLTERYLMEAIGGGADGVQGEEPAQEETAGED